MRFHELDERSLIARIVLASEIRRRPTCEKFKRTFFFFPGGNEEMTKVLRELYEDVNAVELYPGLLAEKRRSNSMFGETLIEMGSPYSLQGLYGNAFASPQLWRPSTFGGEVGFQIVKTATLKKLICLNVPPPCPNVSFKTFGENDEPVTGKADSKSKEKKEL